MNLPAVLEEMLSPTVTEMLDVVKSGNRDKSRGGRPEKPAADVHGEGAAQFAKEIGDVIVAAAATGLGERLKIHNNMILGMAQAFVEESDRDKEAAQAAHLAAMNMNHATAGYIHGLLAGSMRVLAEIELRLNPDAPSEDRVGQIKEMFDAINAGFMSARDAVAAADEPCDCPDCQEARDLGQNSAAPATVH